MKIYREVEVWLHTFITSAALPPGRKPTGTHRIGGWVGLSPFGLGGEENKSPGPAGNRTPVVQPDLS
jgi:hypothetical protein